MIRSQYIRERDKYNRSSRGNPKGLLVMEDNRGEIRFGWSFCHEMDHFNKSLARSIAMQRLQVSPVFNVRDKETLFPYIFSLPEKFQGLAFKFVAGSAIHQLMS